MNYPDIVLAVATVGALTISASMMVYHKVAGPQEKQATVMVKSQDERLDRIEKILDGAVTRQEVILKKLESVEGTQGVGVERDED